MAIKDWELLLSNFLSGHWQNDKLTDQQFKDQLSQYFLNSDDTSHDHLLELLRSFGPRLVCQYQFKVNDIVWICKNCQKDDTCVLCNECFQNSNHDGHEVYFYHSAADGCCDCGDPGAWNCHGFCPRHGKKREEDPVNFVPSEIRNHGGNVLNEITNGIVNFFEFFDNVDLHTVEYRSELSFVDIVLFFDDVHSETEFRSLLGSSQLYDALGITINESQHYQSLKNAGFVSLVKDIPITKANLIISFLSNKGFTSRAMSSNEVFSHRATLISLQWLQSLTLACDGLCYMICRTFTPAKLSKLFEYTIMLDRILYKNLHNLLLGLMADQSFKMHSSVAYSNAFRKISYSYANGCGFYGNSIFNLSVQYLNRENCVHEICYHYGHLFELTNALHVMLCEPPPSISTFYDKIAIKNRRYSSILGDMKIIFILTDISRCFVSECLSSWLEILTNIQGMHQQVRLFDAHVLFENRTWIAATNLSIGLGLLYEYLTNWFSESTSNNQLLVTSDSITKEHRTSITHISALELLEKISNKCFQWQSTLPYLSSLTQILTAELNSSPFKIFNSVSLGTDYKTINHSFHYPLHRFLAYAFFESCKFPHLNETTEQLIVYLTKNLPSCLAMFYVALDPLIFSKQVNQGMWKRNGQNMLDQILNYSSTPFCRIFRDLDLNLLQILGLVLPPGIFYYFIISMFNLSSFLFPNYVDNPTIETEKEFALGLTSEMLEIIISLLTDLPLPATTSLSERLFPLIRREWIHKLACGPTTFSQLLESLNVIYEHQKIPSEELQNILNDISNKNTSNNLSAPTYVLKANCWKEYDPCFSRLNEAGHHKALERQPKLFSPQPIVACPSVPHPVFSQLRSKLLFEETILILIRNVLCSAVAKFVGSDSFIHITSHWDFKINDTVFAKVLQLLTLGIHEAVNEKDENKKEHFFTFLLKEETITLNQPYTYPSILNCLYLLHLDFSKNKGSDLFYIDWILNTSAHECLECNSYLEFLKQQYEFSEQSKLDKQKEDIKKQSQARALQSIQSAAAQFLSMMDELSDSEEEDEGFDDAKSIQLEPTNQLDSSSNEIIATQSPMEESVIEEKSNEMEKVENSDNICIICQVGEDEEDEDDDEDKDFPRKLGLLGLIQPSKVSRSRTYPPFSLSPKLEKVSSLTTKLNSVHDCNARIGFCGHKMHYSCYEIFTQNNLSRNAHQDHLIIDTSKGFFACPLCKKLCNTLFPIEDPPQTLLSMDEEDQITLHGNSSLTWIDWLQSCKQASESPDFQLNAFIKVLKDPTIIRVRSLTTYVLLKQSFDSLFEHMNEDIELFHLVQYYLSFITYSYSCDLSEYMFPGYHLEEIQSIFKAQGVPIKYSPGYDDLKISHESLLSLAGVFHTFNLDKDFPAQFFNILLGNAVKGNGQWQVDSPTYNPPGKTWFSSKLPPLLSLPLFDLTLLMVSIQHCGVGMTFIPSDLIKIPVWDNNHWLKWLVLARLVQLIYTEADLEAEETNASKINLQERVPCIGPLIHIVHRISQAFSYPIPNLYSHSRMIIILKKWLSYLRVILHTICRIPGHPLQTSYLNVLKNNSNNQWVHNEIEELSDEIIKKYFEALNILDSWEMFTITMSENSFIEQIIYHWIEDYTRFLIKEENIISSSQLSTSSLNESDGNSSRKLPRIDPTSVFSSFVSALPSIPSFFMRTPSETLPSGDDSLTIPSQSLSSTKEFHKSFHLFENYLSFPLIKRPELIKLPSEYAKLHAKVLSACNYEYPALCLVCGAVLDAGGQGQCTAHASECSCSTGIFFLVQDSNILLCHGPRASYFSSPYVDIHGENHQNFRGKPLKLDQSRYEALRSLWIKHGILNEVALARSSANRIIISGYY